MPVRRFWLANDCINRISAERDMRQLSLHVATGCEDTFKQYRQQLILEIGNVIDQEERVDTDGLNALRMLAG
jgi:hypothetical protein